MVLPKRKAGAASDVTSEAKQGVWIAPLGKRVAKSVTTTAAVSQKTSAQSGPTTPPNQKCIRRSTCGQAIPVLSSKGKSGRGSVRLTSPHVRRFSRRRHHFPALSKSTTTTIVFTNIAVTAT